MKKLLNKNIIILSITLILIALLLLYGYFRVEPKLIDLNYYDALLDSRFIQKGEIDGEYLIIYTQDNTYKIPKEIVDLKSAGHQFPIEVISSVDLISGTVDILVLLILTFFLYILFKSIKKEPTPISTQKQEVASTQKTQQTTTQNSQSLPTLGLVGYDDYVNRIYPMVSNITFADVAGVSEVKEELEEIIDFLKNPKKYREFGIKLPKGVLLIGPPGVGKTLIAKAVAGEANVPFFYHSGSAFVQMYVGVGAKRVRDLFSRAKAMSPSIIFIDEIDAVGKARGGFRNDEREATLNQLLTEMDGFEERSGVIVIGATNKIEMLDEALLRSGRFDRRIFVGLPNLEERAQIFKVYLKDKPHNVDIQALAKLSVGFSGAAISSFVNEAAIHALKRGSKEIELVDFIAVKDKVMLGKRKKLSFSEEEKKILATYQAAKAIVAYWYEVDFDKISLVSDGFKEIDKEIVSKTEMFSKIKVYLAGMAATEVVYNESFSNNFDDLIKAKMLATEMVEKGMGVKMIGDVNDVSNILDNAYSEMKRFLSGLIPTLQRIGEILLEQETITKEELKRELAEVF